jgi:cobalt-zinc-cadmium efflux system membrane fusion protein
MFVNADILSDVSSANSLPESSLVEIDGKFYVLSLLEKDSSKFILQKTEVQTGQTAGGYTEILNAHIFPRETKFLTKGAFQLIKEEE